MPTAQAVERAVASETHAHAESYHDNGDAAFSVPLLEWYDKHSSRDVPWRKELSTKEIKKLSAAERTARAYEIWVSEIMCQQTQVATVIPYYRKWMKEFPTLADLAKGDLEVVRGLWQGLGYYSRATRLHAGAQKVLDDFGGLMPEDPQVLEKEIPGIGPYTAAAISSIAFGKRVAAVDGNVQRVISRVFALHAPIQAKATLNAIAELAQEVVPGGRPGAHNQAIMDLGYSVCAPRNPKCSSCPLQSRCLAYAETQALKKKPKPSTQPVADACELCTPFDPASELKEEGVTIYPMKKVRKVQREEETAVRIIETSHPALSDRRVLVVQRPEKGLLAGQWEFAAVDLPTEEESTADSRAKALRKRTKEVLGQAVADDPIEWPPVRHTFSHQIRTYLPDSVVVDQALPSRDKRAKWVSRAELETLHLGKAMRLIWNDYLADELRDGKAGKGKKRAGPAKGGQAKKVKVEEASAITRFLVKKAPGERQDVVVREQVAVMEEVAVETSVSPRKKRTIVVSDDENA